MNQLFVYGTLRKAVNHPMHHLLERYAAFTGAGSIPGELYDLGSYPGVFVPERCASRVVGEVYALHDETAAEAWRTLDTYEMCGPTDPEPHLYRRQPMLISLDDGTPTEAWVYVLNTVPPQAVFIPGGDYLTNRW